MGIEIINYRKSEPKVADLVSTAKLFGEVFAGHPWYESTKCESCDTKFGVDTSLGDSCPNCETRLDEANPVREIADSILKDLSEPNGSLYLLKDDDVVRGFGWGYSTSLARTLRHFSESEKSMMMKLNSELLSQEQLFTLSEIGVDSRLRGQGFGKELALRLIADASLIEQVVTVWTRHDAVLAPICLKNGFRQIYGPKIGVSSGRINVEKDFITGVYSSMPERVFFIN